MAAVVSAPPIDDWLSSSRPSIGPRMFASRGTLGGMGSCKSPEAGTAVSARSVRLPVGPGPYGRYDRHV